MVWKDLLLEVKLIHFYKTRLQYCVFSLKCEIFFFSLNIQQKLFKYFRVKRAPVKWLDFNLTFVGFMIFLDALIQTAI